MALPLTPDVLVRLERVRGVDVGGDGRAIVHTTAWNPETPVSSLYEVTDTAVKHLTSAKASSPCAAGFYLGADNAIFAKHGDADSYPVATAPKDAPISEIRCCPVALPAAAAARAAGYDVAVLLVAIEVTVPACTPAGCAPSAPAAPAAPTGGSAMAFDSLPVRHWDTWDAYAKRNHVATVVLVRKSTGTAAAATGAAAPTGTASAAGGGAPNRWVAGSLHDLMVGVGSDCPTKPFGGLEDAALGPDGSTAALNYRDLRDPAAKRTMMWSTATGIHTVRVPIDGLVASAVESYEGYARSWLATRMGLPVAGRLPGDGAAATPAAAGGVWTHSLQLQQVGAASTSAGGATAAAASTAAAPAAPACLTSDRPAAHASPSFSDDGQWLAFLAMERPTYEADAAKPAFVHLATGEIVRPLAAVDVAMSRLTFVGSVAGAAAGGASSRHYILLGSADILARTRTLALVFTPGPTGGATGATCTAFVVDLPHSTSSPALWRSIAADAAAGGAAAAGSVTIEIVAQMQSSCSPIDLVAASVTVPLTSAAAAASSSAPVAARSVSVVVLNDGGAPLAVPVVPLPVLPVTHFRQLTAFNAAVLSCLDLPVPDEYWFRGAHGDAVHAVVIRPPAAARPVSGGKTPVAVLIHGGPQGNYGDDWHYRWNPQTYAAAGYATIAINFHGSTSFGQAFTDSINGDWGGAPFTDVVEGTKAITAACSEWMDADRIAALGASYGGYMVNWLQGNAPAGLFKVMVNHDGVFDTRALFYTTEELWFPEWEFRGTPFDNPALYDAWNPSRHVSKWSTPMLVIHGGLDFRIGEAEGIATFTALQRRGVASRMVYFSDENHWVLKPLNSLRWHAEVLRWLEMHLKA